MKVKHFRSKPHCPDGFSHIKTIDKAEYGHYSKYDVCKAPKDWCSVTQKKCGGSGSTHTLIRNSTQRASAPVVQQAWAKQCGTNWTTVGVTGCKHGKCGQSVTPCPDGFEVLKSGKCKAPSTWCSNSSQKWCGGPNSVHGFENSSK